MIAHKFRWMVATLSVATVLTLGVPASAGAGVYTVYSCQTPGGTPASLNGWQFTSHGHNNFTYNECGQEPGKFFGNAFGGVLEPGHWHSVKADAWAEFVAPAGTEIQGYTLWRAAQIARSGSYR